jgi:transposase-like protein
LVTRRLPAPSDLPTDPLVLDTTATPEKIAAFYGVGEDDVEVTGREHADLPNLHLTQVTNGQYHFQTLADAVAEDRQTADRIQRQLDQVAKVHDHPLIVGRRELRSLFEIPENAAFVHFHGARGLNFEECDAVMVIGAPHPRIDDLERTAGLLAQGREGLQVGGEEHSPRPDCPNPPVYRKLRYEDDQGHGRAVATKHYTGLCGALFREHRKHEIEQVVHRIRPVLADETKHAYLITNVPTDLPVDEVCSLEELVEAPKTMFPVSDGAVDLAKHLAEADAGDALDGFRPGALVETNHGELRFKSREVHRFARAHGLDVSERTVRRWVDQLQEIGLVDAGEYAHREGVDYTAEGATLTRALSVLCGNAGVEVAVKRRLAALAQEAGSPSEWLRIAKGVVDVAGDRCERSDLDPPPDPAG